MLKLPQRGVSLDVLLPQRQPGKKTPHCPRPSPVTLSFFFGCYSFFSWNLNFSNLDTYVSALPNSRRYRSFKTVRHGTCKIDVRQTCKISGGIQVKKSFSFGSVGVSINTSARPTDQLLTARSRSLQSSPTSPGSKTASSPFHYGRQAGLRHLPITCCEKG